MGVGPACVGRVTKHGANGDAREARRTGDDPAHRPLAVRGVARSRSAAAEPPKLCARRSTAAPAAAPSRATAASGRGGAAPGWRGCTQWVCSSAQEMRRGRAHDDEP